MQTIQYLNRGWKFHQVGKPDWYPATIPGCVHLDSLNNQLIEDPFYRDNETKVQWIEKMFWEYRLDFDANPEILSRNNIQLIFEGLDTYATVILNDEEIIHSDNMFRPWQADVKSILKAKKNKLIVRLRSPIMELEQQISTLPYRLPAVHDQLIGTSPYTRKAPYHFQWDWGPRLVTSGIWQPVKLEAWDDIKIIDLFIMTQALTHKKAILEIHLEVLSELSQKVKLLIVDDGKKISVSKNLLLQIGLNKLTHEIKLKNPAIWWPNGYGEQPLYTIHVQLSTGDESITATQRIGLRTLELKREADEWGESFAFVVNDVPIFSKGANWVPTDNFTPRVTTEKYRYLLQSAVQANMNMIRVWGGGIYEADIFYDLCDDLGLLVWQDFMFACAMYPGDEAFLDSVRQEAVYQVRRLRHHPCIALWCGNNEIEVAWQQWGWKKQLPATVWDDYLKLFNGVLNEVCHTEDPLRVYWQSSPGSDLIPSDDANDPHRGDTHYWGVWHGKEPFEKYLEHNPRFISEYGFQSFPEPATVNQFTIETDRDIFSPVMLNHQRSPNGNSLIKEYLGKYYVVPKSFDHFLLLSQLLQAEGVRIGAEHFRRIKPCCMGSLYWQFNDCWPAASWSSIDYYGRWKALHYFARRFYAPILLSPSEETGGFQFYVISDRTESAKADIQIHLLDFSGRLIQQWKKEIVIQPLQSKIYFSIGRTELSTEIDPREIFLYAHLIIGGKTVSENALYFVLPKDLKLPAPQISLDIMPDDAGFSINISSQNLVRSVILRIEEIEGYFDDNFFDLYPGYDRTIHFLTNEKIDTIEFKNRLSYLSLFELMGS